MHCHGVQRGITTPVPENTVAFRHLRATTDNQTDCPQKSSVEDIIKQKGVDSRAAVLLRSISPNRALRILGCIDSGIKNPSAFVTTMVHTERDGAYRVLTVAAPPQKALPQHLLRPTRITSRNDSDTSRGTKRNCNELNKSVTWQCAEKESERTAMVLFDF